MTVFRSFPELSGAMPTLSAAQIDQLGSFGAALDVRAGDALFSAGEPTRALFLLDTASARIFRPATPIAAEAPIIEFGPGHFVGEFTLLTGQNQYLTALVTEGGRVHRIDLTGFRRAMAEDPALSDVLLRALLTRRERLRDSPARDALQIVGAELSAAGLALRTYAARHMLPHRWLDSTSPEAAELLAATGLSAADLPAVVLGDGAIAHATPGLLSEHIGLSRSPADATVEDVVIVGAGPAGLAAAVYAASEGLRTALVDGEGVGGQAARSSRIENFLGFPFGLSGGDLAERAQTQALKFGARIYTPCLVTALDATGPGYRVTLSDGKVITTRTVLLATGARYRTLPLERWAEFEDDGIFYAATEIEGRACGGRPVAVLGGGNSAGQAALFLATRDCSVELVLRGDELDAGMSDYLVQRVRSDPRITVSTGTEVVGLDGDDRLGAIRLRARAGGGTRVQPCSGLFCFIGAEPSTGWLPSIAVDEDGFVLTGVQLGPEQWTEPGRRPLPFETSVPRVFAVGDVRVGSMKRVAAAAGEGASAVPSLHAALAGLRADSA
ncbi:MAG TPA: FAD-dependent oxidoreductase [Mycobacteriales bacterium]|jgi:thioredoxin reductase (NADPH)|nr:FAD-dependent oxidoreductase [Mycobacteriales bacterium]